MGNFLSSFIEGITANQKKAENAKWNTDLERNRSDFKINLGGSEKLNRMADQSFDKYKK